MPWPRGAARPHHPALRVVDVEELLVGLGGHAGILDPAAGVFRLTAGGADGYHHAGRAMPVFRLDDRLVFPPPTWPRTACSRVGGDLRPERLCSATDAASSPGTRRACRSCGTRRIRAWCCDADELLVQRSLRKAMRKRPYQLTLDTAFADVLDGCAQAPRPGQDGTWLTPEMVDAYMPAARARVRALGRGLARRRARRRALRRLARRGVLRRVDVRARARRVEDRVRRARAAARRAGASALDRLPGAHRAPRALRRLRVAARALPGRARESTSTADLARPLAGYEEDAAASGGPAASGR